MRAGDSTPRVATPPLTAEQEGGNDAVAVHASPRHGVVAAGTGSGGGSGTEVAAPLAEVVAKEVTIVITPKDFFSCAVDVLEQLWRATPRVATVLYMDTGPHSVDLATYVAHCEKAISGFQRVVSPDMHNFYELRNTAAARVDTRYTVYVNNDTFVQPGWLEALVSAAEDTPAAGVVAPLVLERSRTHRDTMHVWWKEMALKRLRMKEGEGFEYHLDARFETECLEWDLAELRQRFPTRRQLGFLEDHCFLVRTSAFLERPLHDPKAAYRREFFDLAWTAAAAGWQVWLEPRAVVVYKKVQPAQAEDIIYFMARRGDELCYGSQLHLNAKWGITYTTDRWHEKHRDEQFSGTVLRTDDAGGSTAAGRIMPVRGMTGSAHEARLVVCFLIAAGFNRFKWTTDDGNWKEALQTLQELPFLNLERRYARGEGPLKMEFRQERLLAHALNSSIIPSRSREVPALHRLVADGVLPEHQIDWIEGAKEEDRHFTRQARKHADPYTTGAVLRVRLNPHDSCAAKLRLHASLELQWDPSAETPPRSEMWFWLRGDAAKSHRETVKRLASLLEGRGEVAETCGIELPAMAGESSSGGFRLVQWAYRPLEGKDEVKRMLAAAASFRRWNVNLRRILPTRQQSRKLKVCLSLRSDAGQVLSLEYDVLPSGLARRWYRELHLAAEQQLELKYRNRVYHFEENPQRTLQKAWKQLGACAKAIEEWRAGAVPELHGELAEADPFRTLLTHGDNPGRAVGALQERLNELHKRFEILRGSIDQPAQLFVDAPPRVKEAIQDYNLLIHRIEGILPHYLPWRTQPSPTIVAAFDHRRRRLPLRPSELREFQLRLEFGHMYLNYCEVGKHLLEAFRDEDDVVGLHNLRPQAHLSADAKAFFGESWSPGRSEALRRDVRAWWDAKALSSATGRRWGDPALALGYAPVAALDRSCPALLGLNDSEVVRRVAGYNSVIALRPLGGPQRR